MTLANLDIRRSRLRAVPKPQLRVVLKERGSEVWPDWSTELSPAELAQSAAKNKPSAVLKEAAGAVIYSVGLVILLMTLLSALHVR